MVLLSILLSFTVVRAEISSACAGALAAFTPASVTANLHAHTINILKMTEVPPEPVRYWIADSNSPKRREVGPVLFHAREDFVPDEREVIDELLRMNEDAEMRERAREMHAKRIAHGKLQSALSYGFSAYGASRAIQKRFREEALREQAREDLKHGIEIASIVLQTDSESFKSPAYTSLDPARVNDSEQQLDQLITNLAIQQKLQPKDIRAIRFFHLHPTDEPWGGGVSPGDVDFARKIAEKFARAGWYPEIHIFAIPTHAPGAGIGHYGIKLAPLNVLRPKSA